MNDSTIIDRLGGTKRVATLCKLSMPTVSNWRKHGISKAWRAFLQVSNPEAFKRQRRKRAPESVAS